MLRKVLFICLFVFVLSSSAFAVVVTWNENPEPDIDHYKVLYKHFGDTQYQIVETTNTSIEIDITGDVEVRVIAVDKAGQESPPSETIMFISSPANLEKEEADGVCK